MNLMSRKLSPEEIYYIKIAIRGANRCQIAKDLGRAYCAVDNLVNPKALQKHKQARKVWYDANRELQNEFVRNYNKTEKGKAAAKRYRQSDKGKATKKKYRSSDKGLEQGRKQGSKRRAWKYGAVFEVDGQSVDMIDYIRGDKFGQSLFLDTAADDAFKALTKKAAEMEAATGIQYQVDHLIPLSRGGCHCPENFEIKTAVENQKKNNQLVREDEELFCKRIFNIN